MFKILFSNNYSTYKPLSSDMQNYIQKSMEKFTKNLKELKEITIYNPCENINNASLQINKYYKKNYIFIIYFLAGYHFRYLVEIILYS